MTGLSPAGSDPAAAGADPDFLRFVEQIRAHTRIDLSQYKENQMKRRLTTLRLRHGFSTFDAYWQALSRSPELMDEFLDRMTINVSEFWRNPGRWEVLGSRFLPELLRDNPRLRCWSAACSTGEEPYTLSILLEELGASARSEITATDLDRGVLAKAEAGEYHSRSVKDVPKPLLDKHFKAIPGGFAVRPELRRIIRFRQHNLLDDRFDGPYDLIICRNVMIYFTEEAKTLLYRKFAEALRPGGILFVGSTEQIFSPGDYGLESAETFFYRRKA
ncbi:Chemotaxis protein methyltransferase CheR [Paenibacillus pasadenensis]|uniref:protein-glutamate O-methyltransferase n=1 Tax=Paenibacillus pasadenensis TaxID=217090 RepID=A0A2N5N5M1_9BACL|nr:MULTISPECIES: protein-glutamate O-methyltransferase CheR [Paenibacillus]PLT45654.1 Chemotaxis protein methyltransferase CheR [Paenibacillus pasadenensis]QGG56101.1 chemotaxis protein CheR [Paenibacillus sp. B01]